MSRIPTNVITGFLGVGKTTAVLDLLARKPADERWAVLVNEYGEVSVDGAILEGGGPGGVSVREVAGGCVCCATAPYLPVALHLLLSEGTPRRLIVETTGLGHPGRLLDTLRGPGYRDRLDVRATLTLVSADDFADPKMLGNPVFREQVELADVLVLSKRDRADAGLVERFAAWAETLDPPKLLVAAAEFGRLDPDWLDLSRGSLSLTSPEPTIEPSPRPEEPSHEPGRPVRRPSGATACGWVFSPADVFDEGRLLAFLGGLAVPRLKGVFRVADDWIVVNRVGGGTTVGPTGYRRDSRVEVFAGESADWDAVEAGLMSCMAGRAV
jgi:G3E family GTPase